MPLSQEEKIMLARKVGISDDVIQRKITPTQPGVTGTQAPTTTPPTAPTTSPVMPKTGEFREGDNPLMFGLAKAQETLRDTPLLQILGGLVGRGLGGGTAVGSGVGTGAGTYLQQLLRPGGTIQEKGAGALIPTGEETGEIGKSALTGALLDFLFTGGGVGASPLRPVKFGGKLRDMAAASAEKGGKTLSGERVAQAAIDELERLPTSLRGPAQKNILQAIEKFGGRQLGITEGVGAKTAAGQISRRATGTLKDTAAARIEEAIARSLREQLAEQAPVVSAIDRLFLSPLIRTQKGLGNIAKLAIPLGGAGWMMRQFGGG